MGKPGERKVQLLEQIASGGFGDVWKGKDRLGRLVAVKIIREEASDQSDALAHAQALARANHPNVVTVYAIDRVYVENIDKVQDCVVMELLDGVTLDTLLKSDELTADELNRIGQGIISGLEHIHEQGLTHGDLHEQNVMIGNTTVKIIDILYRGSMADMSTRSREERIRRDLQNLRILIHDLIQHSELGASDAAAFDSRVKIEEGIKSVRRAFTCAIAPKNDGDLQERVDNVFRKLIDPHFVEGDDYAKALFKETPKEGYAAVLMRLVETRKYKSEHKSYIRWLWPELSNDERKTLAHRIAEMLRNDLPNGDWSPNLRFATAMGRPLWSWFPATDRLRIESLIIADVRSGYYDYHTSSISKGSLGTYASSIWIYLEDTGSLHSAIVDTLGRNSWYSQNYIGKYLLSTLVRISAGPELRKRAIEAIVVAIKNDAKLVLANLGKLPDDWAKEARRKGGIKRK